LLLKVLQENYCKRFVSAIWPQLKAKSNHEFATAIEKIKLEYYIPIPAAKLDFGQQPTGEDKPQDRFFGLLMLRRKLATAAFELGCKRKFPRYDFACVWYLHQQGKSREYIKKLFPFEEMECVVYCWMPLHRLFGLT